MTHPGSRGTLSWAGWDITRGPGLCSHGPISLLLPKLGFSCIRIEPGVESWDLGKADVKTEVWSSLRLVTQEEYMQGVGLYSSQDCRP